MGLGSNGCFMADAALIDGHYKIDIISIVGYPRSDSVMLLVSCMITYNIQGTGIVLQVTRDSADFAGNR